MSEMNLSCGACGKGEDLVQTFVVTTLDYTDVRNNRTEACVPCWQGENAPDLTALLAGCQLAANAAFGDSNDKEIELLQGSLEWALHLLGAEMPKAVDPLDDDEEVSG